MIQSRYIGKIEVPIPKIRVHVLDRDGTMKVLDISEVANYVNADHAADIRLAQAQVRVAVWDAVAQSFSNEFGGITWQRE